MNMVKRTNKRDLSLDYIMKGARPVPIELFLKKHSKATQLTGTVEVPENVQIEGVIRDVQPYEGLRRSMLGLKKEHFYRLSVVIQTPPGALCTTYVERTNPSDFDKFTFERLRLILQPGCRIRVYAQRDGSFPTSIYRVAAPFCFLEQYERPSLSFTALLDKKVEKG